MSRKKGKKGRIFIPHEIKIVEIVEFFRELNANMEAENYKRFNITFSSKNLCYVCDSTQNQHIESNTLRIEEPSHPKAWRPSFETPCPELHIPVE